MVVQKFFLTLHSDDENQVTTFKDWLKRASLDGKVIRCSLCKHRDDEFTVPEFEHKVLEIEYEFKAVTKKSESSECVNFIYLFLSQCLDEFGKPLPWLSMMDGKSFFKERRDHHSLLCTELCFGTLVSSSNYLCHYKLEVDEFTTCNIEFFHDIRQIQLHCVRHELEYELVVDYMDIKLIISTYQKLAGYYKTILYLYLCNPPLVYSYQLVWRNHRKERCLRLFSMNADVLGKSRVLRLELRSSNYDEGHLILSRLHVRCNNIPIHYTNVSVTNKVPYPSCNIDLEHFGCTYMLQGIVKRSYFLLECLEDKASAYISSLKEYAKTDPLSLEKTLVDLLHAIDDGEIFDVWITTFKLFSWYTSKRNTEKYFIVPQKTKLVRRLIITPTRWLYWPADVISENRILRKFSADHAIRVTFRDDNYNRLPSSDCEYSIYQETVKKPLTEGIIIGQRKYEFLAWSNSQLREHSVWMYAEDCHKNTVSSIRSWMGKFSSIRNVGKYMARMGQCFSQTEDTISVPLEKNYVQTEDDKTDGFDPVTGKQYCFSDGVGKISVCLAEKVCNALSLKKTCSAFQIRYSGFKGMLTIDPHLKDLNIVFRKSMEKFECPESTRLEIVKVSNPGSLQLNRPLITILDYMGVPHSVFLKIQSEILINMIEMFLDDHKAAECLSSHCSTPYLAFRDLCKADFCLTTEPFFRSLLLAIHKRMTWAIKAKAQVDIDPSEGRNMFGVMDESKKLKYGQVFVQYTKNILAKCAAEATTVILKGRVLVTKNPCLQPGDVRMLEAVDVQDLHHIVDCIVFPQYGKRPHPNEMGGSDLDGDEYTVIWKKELFFQHNFPPRHFPAYEDEQQRLQLRHPVTVTDMIHFLVEFIKNDQIGLIGTAHLVQADRIGLESAVCESIAEKYSVAVDFPKNGLKRRLADNEKSQEYSDFMQKRDKNTYKSSKALGKMFRACQDIVKQVDIASYKYEDIEVDRELVYPGWESYHTKAEESKNRYIQYIKHLMHHYGIQHEAELISGSFTRIHGRHREYQQYRREVEEIVSKSVSTIWKTMRREFLEEFGKIDSDDEMDIPNLHNGLLSKASAWYMVTYTNKNSTYLSFPWIVSDYLIKIKLERMKKSGCHNAYGCSLARLNTILLEERVIQQLPELDNETKKKLHEIETEIPYRIFRTALQLIIKWANKVKIVHEPNAQYLPRNMMNLSSLVGIFIEAMHVNGKFYYSPNEIKNNQEIGPLLLCACFFRFCILLRNITKNEIKTRFPFIHESYKILAKRSGPAYQRLVVSNCIKIFGISTQCHEQFDDEEMEPISIDKAVFDKSVLENSPESFAIDKLQSWSGVTDIRIRKANNRFIINAAGRSPNILVLQQILHKDSKWLKKAFCTGSIPEK